MITAIIITILLLGCLLLATAHLTNINKAATAMFVCTVGWVLYICYGADFVGSQHSEAYLDFLSGLEPTSLNVKLFIYDEIFLKYAGKATGIVMFLLATMTIVEILNNNGCFDFIGQWVRTRSTKQLLWTITLATFIISANLDNLTTTMTMLVVMHGIVQNRRQRMTIACAIVLAANAGGCFTVIGDPAGVALWQGGAVTATNFSAHLALPALVAWVVPTWLMGRDLPDRLDVSWPTLPYRGDSTTLNRWQRVVMLLVGIGGLWFIPTFHSITRLSPFLGALCVLSVLWIVNEIFNRRLMSNDMMVSRRVPMATQYGGLQMILFVMGIVMAMGVVAETGALKTVARLADAYVHSPEAMGIVMGALSGIIDAFTVSMAGISAYPVVEMEQALSSAYPDYMVRFAENGTFWHILAYSTSIGGCLLGFASISGLAMMKMERMHVGWYLKNITPKILIGWTLGYVLLCIEIS